MATYRLKKGTCYLFVNLKKVKLRPGDTVECETWEIPEGFKGSFTEIVPPGEKRATPEEPDAELPDNFYVKHRGGGRYSVFSKGTDKPVNTVHLTRDEAYALAGIPDPKVEIDEAAKEGFESALEGGADLAKE